MKSKCASCGDKLLYTVSEAATLLGYTRWTVGQMLRRKEMGFIPRGRIHKRIPLSEIHLWIQRNMVRNGEELKKALDGRRSASWKNQNTY